MLPGACANWRVPTCAFSSTTTPSASIPTTDTARSCASMHAVQKDANACSNFLSTAGLTDRSSAAGAPANGTTATTAGAAAGTWKNTSGGRDERQSVGGVGYVWAPRFSRSLREVGKATPARTRESSRDSGDIFASTFASHGQLPAQTSG